MNPGVDWFFNKNTKWQKEYYELRTIVLACKLTEELKWGCPCYSFQKKNIVLIHGFKDYCALLFMKGSLLKDAKHILVQQTKNVQIARQIRLSDVQLILKMKSTLKAYIKEAIQIEKSGIKGILKKTSEFDMSEEFKNALEKMPELKTAFYSLTPGRQRGYLLHFSAPKQSKTRKARVEKYLDKILKGNGLDD